MYKPLNLGTGVKSMTNNSVQTINSDAKKYNKNKHIPPTQNKTTLKPNSRQEKTYTKALINARTLTARFDKKIGSEMGEGESKDSY